MYQYQAQLLAIVDGDTMHVQLDLGLDIRVNTTLRIFGVDAPEMRTPEGKTARAWAVEWFAQHAPTGLLTVTTIKDKTEKYGRYLATVTAPDGHVFNDDLLAAHQAKPYNP